MSYILDALRKAEVERERQRQAVPGIHSAGDQQPVYLAYEGNSSPLKWWFFGVIVIAGLGVAYWGLQHRFASAPAAVADTADAKPIVPAIVASAPSPAPSPTPALANVNLDTTTAQQRPATAPVNAGSPTPQPRPQVATKSASVPPDAPLKPTAQPRPEPLPPPIAKPAASKPPAPTELKSAPDLQPVAPRPVYIAAPPLPPTVKSAAPKATADIPAFHDLPEHIRRQMPPIAVAGAVVSESTREWALLVNDKVLTPGSLVAADLYLVEVSANSAVFNYRGQKFRLDR